jgi:hypothetical protein
MAGDHCGVDAHSSRDPFFAVAPLTILATAGWKWNRFCCSLLIDLQQYF